MDLIFKINLRRLTNSVFLNFMRAILKFFTDAVPDTVKVKAEYLKFQAEIANLEKEFNTDKGSDITDVLLTLDAERDDAFCGIRDMVKAMLLHYVDKKRKAAEKLFSNLNTHGTNANNLPLPSETSVLLKMMNEWTTNTDLIAAVSELGFTDWVNYLKLKNLEFETHYQQRDSEAGTKTKDGMRLAKVATTAAYDKLMTMFASQYTVNGGTGIFASLLNDLNGAIDKQNNLLKHSGGKTKDDKTPPAQPQ